jgi:hypothetical protein
MALEMQHLSVYMDCVRGTWRGGSFTGYSKRHVKKGFKKWSISFYRVCRRGTWMEGSCTEASKRRNRRFHKEKLQAISKGGLGHVSEPVLYIFFCFV